MQATENFIKEYFVAPYYDRPGAPEPLLLLCSLQQPHYPFFTEEALFHYYLNRVGIYEDPVETTHPILGKTQYGPNVTASTRDKRRATAAYYGMVEKIDQLYGRILQALENAGEDLDEWVIVYASDHGEMLGQHGLWEKLQFFEASARVPLVVRWPARFKSSLRVHDNVNLCDLFPTFCELAGAEIPTDIDGRSLLSLCKGERRDGPNRTLSFLHKDGTAGVMIKEDNLKFLYFGEDIPPVLFNLEHDSLEKENLSADEAWAQKVFTLTEEASQLLSKMAART